MSSNKRAFEPGEIDVLKYILDEVYYKLEFNGDKNRFVHSETDIELTSEEYANLQSLLEKLGVTIY